MFINVKNKFSRSTRIFFDVSPNLSSVQKWWRFLLSEGSTNVIKSVWWKIKVETWRFINATSICTLQTNSIWSSQFASAVSSCTVRYLKRFKVQNMPRIPKQSNVFFSATEKHFWHNKTFIIFWQVQLICQIYQNSKPFGQWTYLSKVTTSRKYRTEARAARFRKTLSFLTTDSSCICISVCVKFKIDLFTNLHSWRTFSIQYYKEFFYAFTMNLTTNSYNCFRRCYNCWKMCTNLNQTNHFLPV